MEEIDKEYLGYEVCMQDFLNNNFHMLVGMYVKENHDKFMEYATEIYDDVRGKELIWDSK